MVAQQHKPWTLEDFLAWEREQPEPYEFLDGQIVAMVGGTAAHATIKGNVYRALFDRMRGKPCRVFVNSLKVTTANASHYPDVAVTCTGLAPSDDLLPEPVVIVEVLSPSTEDRDRSAKWVNYRTLPTLQHYLLIAQDQRRVELISRAGRGWTLEILEVPIEQVPLTTIDATLTLDEIYEDSGV